MGAVYLAHHQILGHPLAIKHTEYDLRLGGGGAESRAEFLREGVLLASLDHPSIVKVADCFADDNGCFLVMSFIDGQTLGAHIRACDGHVDLLQGLAWAREICEAVRYLHTCNPAVLYRDLKPDNVMIDRGGRVCLLDMGIARRDAPDEHTRTALKGWGTPVYSAPEQLAGLKTDVRADIYAYGATLYALFTGQRPTECLKRLLHSEPLTPPLELNPDLPARLNALIVTAMAMRAEDRFQSMAEIALEIVALEEATTDRTDEPPRPKLKLPVLPPGPLAVKRRSPGLGDAPRSPSRPEPPMPAPCGPVAGREGEARSAPLPSPSDHAEPSAEALPVPASVVSDLPTPALPTSTKDSATGSGSRDRGSHLVIAAACALLLLLTIVLSSSGPPALVARAVVALTRAVGGGPALTLLVLFGPLLGGALVAGLNGATRLMLVCLFLVFLQLYPLGVGLGTAADALGGNLGSLLALSAGARAKASVALRVASAGVCACLVVALIVTASGRSAGARRHGI